MNKWTYVRVGLIFLYAYFRSWQGPVSNHAQPPSDGVTLLVALIAGMLSILLVVGSQTLNRKTADIWTRPSWAENPFNLKQPLQFFHFFSWLIIVSSSLAVALTEFYDYTYNGLMPLSLGVGLLAGVHLARFIFQNKFRNV